MPPQAQVLPIPPGSLLVLTDVGFPPDDAAEMVGELYRSVGHRDFGVLLLDAGAAEVFGPDEVVERVRSLLAEAGR